MSVKFSKREFPSTTFSFTEHFPFEVIMREKPMSGEAANSIKANAGCVSYTWLFHHAQSCTSRTIYTAAH